MSPHEYVTILSVAQIYNFFEFAQQARTFSDMISELVLLLRIDIKIVTHSICAWIFSLPIILSLRSQPF